MKLNIEWLYIADGFLILMAAIFAILLIWDWPDCFYLRWLATAAVTWVLILIVEINQQRSLR
jgi:hypothetical protein